MASNTYSATRLSLRNVSNSATSIAAARARAQPSSRHFHTSYRRQRDEIPTRGASASSSSSGSSAPKSGSRLSIVNILVVSAAIVIATPKALDLYGRVTGTTPPGSASSSIPGKLEPYTHRPLPLVSSTYYPDAGTTSAHKLLQIALPASITASAAPATNDVRKMLRIRSIYIKEPSLVIERAYTPLYDTLPGSYSAALVGASSEEKHTLDLLVKRYADGELGRMLHRAVPNATVPQLEVRGPVDTWSFERDSAAGGVPERIVMVVGGTGVTPAFQLVTSLFGRPGSGRAQLVGVPKVDVLYATPDLESALLLPQLHALKEEHRDKVSVSLFAERVAASLSPADRAALGPQLSASSASGAFSSRSWLSSIFGKSSSTSDAKLELTAVGAATSIPVYESRITRQHLEHVLSATKTGRTLVLVSGPDGMVDALAGPKSRDGQRQGALSGMLAALGCRQEDVFKL
ncbi:related to CYC2-cytochrome-c mitochondrial import factor [Sporisorium reilianum f. sp. reilianum]|uniref:Related to CYC2-cytochrome-c mitochondrial import factor n=1 Tax=Sporisorium reilianum f. sp. reilianum TaxID=72559 RepID=A0A2N8U6Q4_9BASI|nr:related to CYC2-cytochrome-c mitochondrial import factor [Sporisorium reilianum f. sp. reilianum]